jgi:hypothetical protein
VAFDYNNDSERSSPKYSRLNSLIHLDYLQGSFNLALDWRVVAQSACKCDGNIGVQVSKSEPQNFLAQDKLLALEALSLTEAIVE